MNVTIGYHTRTCTFNKIPNSYSDLPVLVIVIILMNVLVDCSNVYLNDGLNHAKSTWLDLLSVWKHPKESIIKQITRKPLVKSLEILLASLYRPDNEIHISPRNRILSCKMYLRVEINSMNNLQTTCLEVFPSIFWLLIASTRSIPSFAF